MKNDSHPAASLFTQVDATPATASPQAIRSTPANEEHSQLLRDILAAQDRQNELLEELINQIGSAQRQRNAELTQWKQANPRLAKNCRMAADVLGKVQTEFLDSMTNEINENSDDLMDGEFVLNEFVDRFGPRLAHLNGVLQVLAQLGSVPGATNNNQS